MLHDERLGITTTARSSEPTPQLVRLLGRLRGVVTQHVAQRRVEGAPVERVLPEVKRLVRQAELEEGWFDPTDALMAQVIRCAIAAYYDEPSLQHVPRFY